MVDDLNDWVGPLAGHPDARTPAIDRLAARGTLFTNAHAAAPLCGPARAALLTGLRPSTTGIYGQATIEVIRGNRAARNATLLPECFRNHGYLTIGTGKTFHEGSPRSAYDVVGLERRDFGPFPRSG